MSTIDEIRTTLIEADRQGGLINALVSAELRTQRRGLGKVLSELHNTDLINLTAKQNLLAIDALDQNQFWIVIHPLDKAIPDLRCTHREILELVHKLVQKAGSDGAAGLPNLSLVTWSRQNTDEARKIVDGVRALDALCIDHGVFAILGLGEESLAFELIQNTKNPVIGVGLRALGRMETITVSGIKKGIDETFAVIESETDFDIRISAIEAAFRLWEKKEPSKPYRQREFIETIGKGHDPNEFSFLSAMLFHHNEGLTKETVDLLLSMLSTKPSNAGATLRNVDYAVNKDDNRWEFEQVASVFATCIPQLEQKPDHRDYHSFPEWVWSSSENASYLFAEWLNSGNRQLCSYLAELLSGFDKGANAWIEKAHLPPDTNDQIFIARKCVGFLWHHEVTAASVLLSIVKNGKSPARAIAEELLFNPLLLSYGGDLRAFLEAQSKNKSKRISDCVKRLLAKHDKHIAGVETTNDLVELLPSIEQRRAVAMKDHERNRDIQKQAQERSIFANLVTRQTLLYGRKSFSLIHGADGAKHPNVSTLSEISHSIELPRLMVIDPVGFNKMITVFRAEQRRPA
ncbi:MAG: hypothetical protein ACSHXB_18865 [Sulfitobacter sp.]